ncbi:MAG: hypothetical protein K1X83_02240 [Oligoflexia bacterium]|nr:hypothetical protein [Oligoflexia bacterium]
MGMMEDSATPAVSPVRCPRRLKEVVESGIAAARLLSSEDAQAIEAAAYRACQDEAGPTFHLREFAQWPAEFAGHTRVFKLNPFRSDQVDGVYFRCPSGQAVELSLEGESALEGTSAAVLSCLGFTRDLPYLSVGSGELEGDYHGISV